MHPESMRVVIAALCALSRLDADRLPESMRYVENSVRKEEFVSTAVRLRVAPLVFWNIRKLDESGCCDSSGRAVLAELEPHYRRYTERNSLLTTEVDRIAQVAKDVGVRFAVRKGGYLGEEIYPEPGLRPLGDIDILVAADEVDSMMAGLDAHGYSPGKPRGDRIEPLDRDSRLFWSLYVAGRPSRLRVTGNPAWPIIEIDSRVDLFNRNQGYTVPVDDLLDRGSADQRRGPACIRLSLEDTVLDICLTLYKIGTTLREMARGKHHRLINFADMVNLLSAAEPEFSWAVFLGRVVEYGVHRPVLFALAHLDMLFPDLVPSDVLSTLRSAVDNWPVFLDEYGQWELPEPRVWSADFLTRFGSASVDEEIPEYVSPV